MDKLKTLIANGQLSVNELIASDNLIYCADRFMFYNYRNSKNGKGYQRIKNK